MDTNRIALYLSWHLPPYYKPFDKLEFSDIINAHSSWLINRDECKYIDSLSWWSIQQYYSMCLNKLQKFSIDKFQSFILDLWIPADAMWEVKSEAEWTLYNDDILLLRNQLHQLQKPLVLTEWRSDVEILQTAWSKLYNNTPIPFEIRCTWNWSKNSWWAKWLTNQLEYSVVISEYRPILWIYDNDDEWYNAMNWLDKSLFEDFSNETTEGKKHIDKDIIAIVLPVPESRKTYIQPKSRHLEIEHYFSDEVLKSRLMISESSFKGIDIFDIWKAKVNFATFVSQLDVSEFLNFKILFDEVINNLKLIDHRIHE